MLMILMILTIILIIIVKTPIKINSQLTRPIKTSYKPPKQAPGTQSPLHSSFFSLPTQESAVQMYNCHKNARMTMQETTEICWRPNRKE